MKGKKRDHLPHNSSYNQYSQEWENPHPERNDNDWRIHHSDREISRLLNYQETDITYHGILSRNNTRLSHHERQSARYCDRIQQVSIAMKEHNKQYPNYTNEWKRYRTNTLINMEHNLPTRLTPVQVMTHTNLATYL